LKNVFPAARGYDELIATIPVIAQEIADADPLQREGRLAEAVEFYRTSFQQMAPRDLYARRWADSVMTTIRELVKESDAARVAAVGSDAVRHVSEERGASALPPA
jgi:hypothetical protein